MKVGAKERRFLDALEALFTGAEVEGDSGFINLMRMKRGYFRSLRPKLMDAIDRRTKQESAFREELFDKLHTFFSRYFCESGSIYFRHLPAFAKTYERVYAEGADVALAWKTRMLYYVKSDVLVRSMPVTLDDGGGAGRVRRFYFDASAVEHKQNNERREFVFAFAKKERTPEGPVVHLKVGYSQKGRKTNPVAIVKQAKTAPGVKVTLTEDDLECAFRVFRRQTEADYFINKDSRGFLREQFDLWLYHYMFQEETIFEQPRLAQLQAIQQTAYDIIDFIAQFEDELRRAWEKPKFVRNVNYVVTLDKLPAALLAKIARHPGAKAQVEEWRKLGLVAENFSMSLIGERRHRGNGNYKFLPLDTRHFKSLELDILGALGDLDQTLDGELVRTENWQALNTLQERYQGKAKCIYIDPPYNTGNDDFQYRDRYADSSWLSMMQDRLALADHWLDQTSGSHAISIDDRELPALLILLRNTELGWATKTIAVKMAEPTGVKMAHVIRSGGIPKLKETIILSKPSGLQGFSIERTPKEQWDPEYNLFVTGLLRDEVKHLKHIVEKLNRTDEDVTGADEFCQRIVLRPVAEILAENRILPKQVEAWRYENAWRIARTVATTANAKKLADEKAGNFSTNCFTVVTPQQRMYIIRAGYEMSAEQPRIRLLFADDYLTVHPGDFWQDIKTTGLDNEGGVELISGKKPEKLVRRLIWMTSSSGDLVCDYFLGSGTTTAVAHKMGRKWIGFESANYFDDLALHRMKLVLSGENGGISEEEDWKGGGFFKYYGLEQYEETLRNSRYDDGEQLTLDSTKSPFEQYVFFGDDKLAQAAKPLKNGKLKINLRSLYPDIDIAESLANIVGKPIRYRTADSVTFADGTTEKIDPARMTEDEKLHFVSLIRPYLWWGTS